MSKSRKSVIPHLHSTASNVEVGKSIVSVSLSLYSITFCKPKEVALCFATDSNGIFFTSTAILLVIINGLGSWIGAIAVRRVK